MIVPGPGSLRVVRSAVPGGEALAAFVVSPEFLHAAEVLKEDRGSTVFAADVPAEVAARAGLTPPGRIVVKVMAHDRPVKRFFQRAFGTTRHMRQWNGAELLLMKGFAAQRPLALFRSRGAAGEKCESLVLEWLPGKTLLQLMAERGLTVRDEHALADAVGAVLGELMSKCLVPDDIKPSNIMVNIHNQRPTLAFLDTAGANACEWLHQIDPRRRCLELVLEPLGTGCLPRRALLWRTLRHVRSLYRPPGVRRENVPFKHLSLKECWRAIEDGIRAHGDPTPKVDPLRPSRRAVT